MHIDKIRFGDYREKGESRNDDIDVVGFLIYGSMLSTLSRSNLASGRKLLARLFTEEAL
jgi:hypothetical protein